MARFITIIVSFVVVLLLAEVSHSAETRLVKALVCSSVDGIDRFVDEWDGENDQEVLRDINKDTDKCRVAMLYVVVEEVLDTNVQTANGPFQIARVNVVKVVTLLGPVPVEPPTAAYIAVRGQ